MTLRSFDEYRTKIESDSAVLAQRETLERSLMADGLEFQVPGWCYLCSGESEFLVTEEYSWEVDGIRMPNWREHLRCQACGLNNRMRATIHILEKVFALEADARVFVTEMVTPLHAELKKRFPKLVGSEFLRDGTEGGAINPAGVRHEDVTELSFPDASFDAVLSFDVFEHVPGYLKAFTECARVLGDGGLFYFSVPFLPDRPDTLVRAEVDPQGEIVHHLPPEFHGDPLTGEGCLAFYHFGWDLLSSLRGCGFRDVGVHAYWSRPLGYLGPHQLIFSARKRAP